MVISNAIYPFRQEGELCFLRLAPVEEKIEQNVLGELEFIQYLANHNFNAPEPINTLSGKTFLKLNTKWGEYYASAFKKVCGVPMEELNLTDKVVYQYGKSLGKLHSLSANFIPEIKKWTYNEVLECIIGLPWILNRHLLPCQKIYMAKI